MSAPRTRWRLRNRWSRCCAANSACRPTTLLIALQSVSADGDAARKPRFELNGQSPTVRVTWPDAGKRVLGRPLADPIDPRHVAAPMPGAIVNVAVVPGQRVSAGSTLLALEAMKAMKAMKMETHVTADREAEVEAVLVAAADRVQAKQLLIVLPAVAG